MNNESVSRAILKKSDLRVVGLSRLIARIFVFAGLMALSMPWPAAAQARPGVVISSVLEPLPPGVQPGGQILLQAVVKARGLITRPGTVTFYLAQGQSRGPNDILLATTSVTPVSLLLAPQTVAIPAPIPAEVPEGFYFVLACTGTTSNCVSTPAPILITVEGLSTLDQSAGTTSTSPPAREYFPENPSDGIAVSSPFDCPFTFGQWPSSCVWVTTPVLTPEFPGFQQGLFYCPSDRPYPFQVAIGSDPQWEDLTKPFGARGQTNGTSFTKYKSNIFNIPLSYTGFARTAKPGPGDRGYALFRFRDCGTGDSGLTPCNPGGISGQARFLCTNKPTTEALP